MQLDGITERIDILINNAGVMGLSDRTLSENDVEMQFATHYLGHFLYTNLLMGKMVSSAARGPRGRTRIVNITSAGHVLAPVRFSDYNYEGRPVPPEEHPDVTIAAKTGMADVDPQSGYLPLFAYAQSNTANMLFTVQLAESLQEKGICSFSAAPGGLFCLLVMLCSLHQLIRPNSSRNRTSTSYAQRFPQSVHVLEDAKSRCCNFSGCCV
jgi:NAD(P)-dependent dehydrogenase (short-subunit alcohol dehydrogenase family)